MNLTDIFTPQTRAKVYMAVGIAGLVIGAAGAGIGAFAAAGASVPLIVGAVLSAANAIYAFVAGAFGFIAQANTPSATPVVRLETDEGVHYVNPEYNQHVLAGSDGKVLLVDVAEQVANTHSPYEVEDDSEPVG